MLLFQNKISSLFINLSLCSQLVLSATGFSGPSKNTTAALKDEALITAIEVQKKQADVKARLTSLGFPELLPNTTTARKNHFILSEQVMSKSWGLSNIGFLKFSADQKTNSENIISKCVDSTVVVAVIDTGIDYTHPSLMNHLWTNKGEVGVWKGKSATCIDKSCNGIDDDENGFVDDVIGWDFVNNVSLPYDQHGHGTHISGIISSQPVEGNGISGVCPGVRIMSLKYYDATGSGANNLMNTVKAFDYAIAMGAKIINYSGGGSESSQLEKEVIMRARDANVLVVAAAGNDGRDNKRIPYFPASYGLDNIISVASINQDSHLLPSSNYGPLVDIAAPGLSILSTVPKGRIATMSGTSQATAFVTGAAALVLSQSSGDLKVSYLELRKWVLTTDVQLPGDDKKLVTGGRLSVAMALDGATKGLTNLLANAKTASIKPLALNKNVSNKRNSVRVISKALALRSDAKSSSKITE